MVHSGIWEALDRVITIEFRSAELNPGTLGVLYDAAREKLGKQANCGFRVGEIMWEVVLIRDPVKCFVADCSACCCIVGFTSA